MRLFRRASIVITFVVGVGCCSAARANETVQVCGSYANNVFSSSSAPGIAATGQCPTPSYNGGGFGLFNVGTATAGAVGRWQTVAPAGLELVGATAEQLTTAGVNDGFGYGGGFYYAGGGPQVNDSTQGSLGMIFPVPSSYFGMQLICGWSTCNQPATFTVGAFALYVEETIGPSLAAPIGLWQASGWVRGTWPFSAWGNSPSGLCWLSASLNGLVINSTSSTQDVSTWHQCAAPPIVQPVDTSRYGQGAVRLVLSASDAAGLLGNVAKTVDIDNSTPTVSLGGPVDAPATAGTQYITASAGGSSSGIADIVCSVDGAPAQWYAGASAQVPVSGIGSHNVSCYALDNAVDPSGVHGRSATATWSLRIGQPTEVGISFDKFVGLICRRVRVPVPGRVRVVRRHGRRVRITIAPGSRVERVMRCHPRTVRRRTVVFVPVRRHGRLVRVRRIRVVSVVVPPHLIAKTSRVVAFGHRTTVNGWLGTPAGYALGGHIVRVLTAPDNGSNAFTTAAVAVTAANGSWSAMLPPGPSRLVQAVYDGDPATETAASGQVRMIVPARVKLLSVWPRHVAWSGTVRITGQLVGGYLPPGGALVRLRIGQGSTYTTYGVQEHVTGNGRFTTTYTFGAGQASTHQRFWFQIASLPMGSYPFAPSASGRRSVLVGGHPSLPPRRPHHHHPRRRVARR